MSQDDIFNFIETLDPPKIKPIENELWEVVENYMMDPNNYLEKQP